MKKGTLAATALAVGAGATGAVGTAAAQDEDEDEVVIQGSDYYPGEEFTVLTEFETTTRDDFFDNLDEDEDEFDDISDWDVYSIRIESGGPGGRLAHMMVDTDDSDVDPDAGDTGTFAETASFRNPELNLLELDATLEEVDDDDEDDEDDEEEENDEEDDT